MKGVIAAVFALFCVAGCSSTQEKEPTKADFSSRPPPPGWHQESGAPTVPPNVGK